MERLPADGLPGFTSATAPCSILSCWPANISCAALELSSRPAAIRLLPSCRCDWEICAAFTRLQSQPWVFLQHTQRGLHPAYTPLQHLHFGSACLKSVMLASNDKERAVSLMLRTLLRTFVRIPVHLYFNSIHCTVVTQHSVTQLRHCTSSFFHTQDVL